VIGDGFGNSLGAASDLPPLRFDRAHRLLSAISMIAPSPDWFAGVDGYSMRNRDTNTWLDEVVLDLYPLDAGTDAGTTYTSRDRDESPARPVTLLTSRNSIFAGRDGKVLPVARLRCTLRG